MIADSDSNATVNGNENEKRPLYALSIDQIQDTTMKSRYATVIEENKKYEKSTNLSNKDDTLITTGNISPTIQYASLDNVLISGSTPELNNGCQIEVPDQLVCDKLQKLATVDESWNQLLPIRPALKRFYSCPGEVTKKEIPVPKTSKSEPNFKISVDEA